MFLAGVVTSLFPFLRMVDYPLALVLAVTSSVLFACWGVVRSSRVESLFSATAHTALLAAVSTLLAALPALVMSAMTVPCEIAYGLLFLVLGPFPTAWFAGLTGILVGRSLTGGSQRPVGGLGALLRGLAGRIFLALGIVFLCDLVALAEFFWSPAIAFYGTFFGLYHGAVYDEAVFVDAPLLWLRLKDILVFGSAIAWVDHPASDIGHRPSTIDHPRWRWGVSGAAALVLVASPWLGFVQTALPLHHELSQVHVTGPIVLQCTPNGIACRQADMLLDDLTFHHYRIREFYDLPEFSDPIHVFVYESTGQKQRLMGARETSLAKPWRGEVHIHQHVPAGNLLAHELAHVMLARASNSPLGLPSRWGLVPRPGVLEGAAVAIERGGVEMTSHEWGRALDILDKMPPMDRIMDGFGFWTLPSGIAYPAVGSFVRFLVEHRGSAPFLRVYGGCPWQEAYGQPLEGLLEDWRKFLASIVLDEGQLELAKMVFDRPAVFQKTCPYAGGRCVVRTARALARDHPGQAMGWAGLGIRMTGRDPGTTSRLVSLFLRRDHADLALDLWEFGLGEFGVEDSGEGQSGPENGVTPTTGRMAELGQHLLWCDGLWLSGRDGQARECYEDIRRSQDSPFLGFGFEWRTILAADPDLPRHIRRIATGHASWRDVMSAWPPPTPTVREGPSPCAAVRTGLFLAQWADAREEAFSALGSWEECAATQSFTAEAKRSVFWTMAELLISSRRFDEAELWLQRVETMECDTAAAEATELLRTKIHHDRFGQDGGRDDDRRSGVRSTLQRVKPASQAGHEAASPVLGQDSLADDLVHHGNRLLQQLGGLFASGFGSGQRLAHEGLHCTAVVVVASAVFQALSVSFDC